jgi:hypothetical protein
MALKMQAKAEVNTELKWFNFDDETKVLLAGTDTPEYRIALERYNRRVARNDAKFGEGSIGVVEGELTDLQNHAMLLGHFIVKGWEGVEDEQGKPVKYTAAAAAQLLESNVEFLLFVLRGGVKVDEQKQEELDETVKKPSTGSSGRKTGPVPRSARSSSKA